MTRSEDNASESPMHLGDAKVLITGSAQGVGATTARAVVDAGGTVVLADINADKVAATAEGLGERASSCVLDVAQADSWAEAVPRAAEAMDGLTALVNNAAILHLGPLETMDPSHLEKLLSINLLGPALGVRAVTPFLRDAGGGSIVNISSVAGLEGRTSTVAYTASKWGVRGLTKAAAVELGRFGIRVNAVCASMGNPDMFKPFMEQFDYDQYFRTSPQPALIVDGKPREPDMGDVAGMVLWLLSPAAQVCTGADFVVDGGWTAGAYVSGMPGWEIERDFVAGGRAL